MCATLATVADDGNVFGLDEVDIGIPIIINAHRFFLPYA
jgi:hypothetical protein